MILAFDEYRLDATRLELRRDGQPVRADRMVLKLLGALLDRAGMLVTKAELMARVWDGRAVSENVISVSIARLRKTLRHDDSAREFVVSVQGRGYRFVRPVTTVEAGSEPEAPTPALRVAPGFVGRTQVMARLSAAVEDARSGRGSVCLLTGEPGIGKTAAAEQLARAAGHAGMAVAWSYCQEAFETPPLWPFAQLVRALVRDRAADDGAAEAIPPELCWLLPERAKEATGERPAEKHRLFEAVLGVLEGAAEERGCLLIVDDIHRADAASLELLRYFLPRIAHTRVLLVATLRLGRALHALADVDLAHVVSHRNAARIALERLDREAVSAYVTGILPDPDGSLAEAVWTKSEGNPFFMVELSRQLADASSPDARTLDVRDEALLLLKPRILALDAGARGLLSCAAVVGRRFELRLLARVTGNSLATLTAYLDAAVASEAIVPDSETTSAFVFGHDLIRKLIYDALPSDARRKLHRAIFEALLALAREGEVVPSAVLAHHAHACLPLGDAQTALDYCQRAALEATLAFAHADGVHHLQRALEAESLLEKPNPSIRLLVLFQQAVSARIAGMPGFEQLVHQAADVARAMRSGRMLIEVAMLLHLQPGFPAPPRARALLEEGLALLGPNESASRGAALARLATSGPLAFDGVQSRAQLDQALALVEGENALLASYNAYSAAHYLTGGPTQEDDEARARSVLERLCLQHPRMLRIAPILLDVHAAIIAHQAGRLDVAHGALARAAQRCRETGTRELTWHVARYQLLARLHHVEAATIADELRGLHEQAHRESIVGSALMCAFDRVVVLDEQPEADLLRDVLSYSSDDPPSVWSMKVHALAALGMHEAARAALAVVSPEALAALPHDRDYLGTLGTLARVAVMLGSRAHIDVLYRLLSPHTGQLAVHVSYFCLGPIAQLLGELSSARGQHADAVAHWDRAARHADRLTLPMHASAARRARELASAQPRLSRPD